MTGWYFSSIVEKWDRGTIIDTFMPIIYLDHEKKKQTISDIDVFISTIHLKDLVALFAPKAAA